MLIHQDVCIVRSGVIFWLSSFLEKVIEAGPGFCSRDRLGNVNHLFAPKCPWLRKIKPRESLAYCKLPKSFGLV